MGNAELEELARMRAEAKALKEKEEQEQAEKDALKAKREAFKARQSSFLNNKSKSSDDKNVAEVKKAYSARKFDKLLKKQLSGEGVAKKTMGGAQNDMSDYNQGQDDSINYLTAPVRLPWRVSSDLSPEEQEKQAIAEGQAWQLVEEEGTAPYYYNSVSGESTFEQPPPLEFLARRSEQGLVSDPLNDPRQWTEELDEASGCLYYLNAVTLDSVWEVPVCVTAARHHKVQQFKQEIQQSEQVYEPAPYESVQPQHTQQEQETCTQQQEEQQESHQTSPPPPPPARYSQLNPPPPPPPRPSSTSNPPPPPPSRNSQSDSESQTSSKSQSLESSTVTTPPPPPPAPSRLSSVNPPPPPPPALSSSSSVVSGQQSTAHTESGNDQHEVEVKVQYEDDDNSFNSSQTPPKSSSVSPNALLSSADNEHEKVQVQIEVPPNQRLSSVDVTDKEQKDSTEQSINDTTINSNGEQVQKLQQEQEEIKQPQESQQEANEDKAAPIVHERRSSTTRFPKHKRGSLSTLSKRKASMTSPTHGGGDNKEITFPVSEADGKEQSEDDHLKQSSPVSSTQIDSNPSLDDNNTTPEKDVASDNKSVSGDTGRDNDDRGMMYADKTTAELLEQLEGLRFEDYIAANFNLNRKGVGKSQTTIEKISNWKKDLIKLSLLSHPNESDIEKASVQVFRNITGYMGDRSSKKNKMQHIHKIYDLVNKHSNARFQDEIFCQICKQTNKNPSLASTINGWELMMLCLAVFPPSAHLMLPLMVYCASVVESVKSNDPIVLQFAETCLHNVHKITTLGKQEVPSDEEIEKIQKGHITYNLKSYQI